MSEKGIGNRESGIGKPATPEKEEAFQACYDPLGKLDEINDIIAETLSNLPAAPENRAVHLSEALERICKLCPPKEPSAPISALPEPQKCRYWLELPRGVVLQRFVNTKREMHFVGQYRSDSKSNPNPRRVYTIDVLPIWDDGEDKYLKLSKAFEVGVHEDGKLLFKITTLRGRANAEYLGVKALKAWLVHLDRKSEECVKAQRKRHRKAHRAEYRKRYKANLKARKAAQKGEA